MVTSIILLHGAIGASDQLIPLGNELKENNFDVFYLNFSGHGRQNFEIDFGVKQFVDELSSFISKNKLQQPHVFGYSMGGYVALYLASEKPEMIGTIFTLGTKFEWSPEIAVKEIKMLDKKTILEKVPKFAEALQKRHGDKWEILLRKTSNMMMALGNNNLLNAERFSKIKNKVFVGWAEQDTMVSLTETKNVHHQIKNCELYSVTNTKHPIETVNSVTLALRIRKFLLNEM